MGLFLTMGFLFKSTLLYFLYFSPIKPLKWHNDTDNQVTNVQEQFKRFNDQFCVQDHSMYLFLKRATWVTLS